jgi:hypothetical protein
MYTKKLKNIKKFMGKNKFIIIFLLCVLTLGSIIFTNLYPKKEVIKALGYTDDPYEYNFFILKEMFLSEGIDLDYIIYKELERIKSGYFIFNPPLVMKVGVKERIEARITEKTTENLYKKLNGKGIPQLEKIEVYPVMSVDLEGEGFNILGFTNDEQLLGSSDFTQWEWDVTPLESGIKILKPVIRIDIQLNLLTGEEGFYLTEIEKLYPSDEYTVIVTPNWTFSIKMFAKKYWQGITAVATIIAAFITGIFYVIKNKNKPEMKKRSRRFRRFRRL